MAYVPIYKRSRDHLVNSQPQQLFLLFIIPRCTCSGSHMYLFSLFLRSYMQEIVNFTMGASWVPHPTLTLLRLDRELRDFGRRGFHMSHTPLISPYLLMSAFLLLLTYMSRSSVTISMRRLLDKAHSSTRYDYITMFYIACA